MSDERHAFTITNGEVSTVARSRRRLPALVAFLVVAALLISFYDLLLLALGL